MAIAGTKQDWLRFADNLKGELSKSASPDTVETLEVDRPRLLSDDFAEVTLEVVGEDHLEQMRRSGSRQRANALILWLAIAAGVIGLYLINRLQR